MQRVRVPGSMRTLVGAAFVAVVVPLILSSCYPGEVTSVGELDLVVTVFDPDENFRLNRTYAMPDTIIHRTDISGETDSLLNRSNDAAILERVAANMDAYGYRRIAEEDLETDPPSVVLLVSAVASTNVQLYAAYPPWGWYYPGYCPGCGYYYPWGPSVGGSTYRTGTLAIDMISTSEIDPDNPTQSAAVWSGVVNGALEGSEAGQRDRVLGGVDQAFEQSPYLKLN